MSLESKLNAKEVKGKSMNLAIRKPHRPRIDSIDSFQNAYTERQKFTLRLDKNTEERKDLERRSETKFCFRNYDLPRLRTFLSSTCSKQQFSSTASEVHSIYFDTPSLESCRANLNGLSIRKKLRIRWYDSQQPIDHFFLEEKWRRNRVTGKNRHRIFFQGPMPKLSSGTFHSKLLDVAPKKLKSTVARLPIPIVHIVYQREHFVSLDQKVRFTVDWNLRFARPTLGQSTIAIQYKNIHDLVVLEAKTSVGSEHLIQKIVRPLVGRVQRCSKYVTACQHMGWLPNS